MTQRRKFLLQTLRQVQAHEAHGSRDILTIASLMTDDQVAAHLAACVIQAERRAR